MSQNVPIAELRADLSFTSHGRHRKSSTLFQQRDNPIE